MRSEARRPWMKFYPSDWRADPLLRSCAPLSRYVWLEMIGLMHEAEPYGHLIFGGRAMTPEQLGRMIAMDSHDVAIALAELESMGVFSLTSDGVIFSRRMVRDEKKHLRAANFGKKGAIAKALKDNEEKQTLKGGLEGSLEDRLEQNEQKTGEDILKPRVQRPEAREESSSVSPPSDEKRKTPYPEDFEPEEFGATSKSRAIVDGWSRVEFETQLERFAAHHRKEGSRFKSWQDAWSTWVLNSPSFGDRSASRMIGGGSASSSYADQVLAEAEAERQSAPAKRSSGGARS